MDQFMFKKLQDVVFWSTSLRTSKQKDLIVQSSPKQAVDPATGKHGQSLLTAPETRDTDDVQTVYEPDVSKPARPVRSAPKRVQGSRSGRKAIDTKPSLLSKRTFHLQPLIFFFSLTGSTEKYSRSLYQSLRSQKLNETTTVLEPQILNIVDIEFDDFFITPPKLTNPVDTLPFYLMLVPTYDIDTLLDTLLSHLEETHHDFRVDNAPLSAVAGYSVFGFGDRHGWPSESEGFCSQAKAIDKWMAKLTNRKRAFPLGMGDIKSDIDAKFDEWVSGVQETMRNILSDGGLGEGVQGSGDAVESNDEDDVAEDALPIVKQRSTSLKRGGKRNTGDSSLGDLEDLGRKMPSDMISAIGDSSGPIPVDFTTFSKNSPVEQQMKEMVPKTSPTYATLTKQGYTIIGSHSGVKICRWTKSALRGRGSCYKHSFYGIASHLCMETTPSLSCSNKCVFCWRHGTNPVGTTWRWQVDPPEMIYEGAVAGHLKKIKMMRGVPGVRADRFQEAMRIRHCALSLVGEPIFYPHINEFVSLLHKNRISSFLVCNAQHPDQLAALRTVTQLYVSIDASNRDELRRVDRPLHRDFWERFIRCLDILRARRQEMRTVYRLTLVKGFNLDEEAEGYADLVARGLPCFVEIKGVTYCGSSAGLTMQNVPFWHEVVKFVELLNAALARRGLDYGIAAEHAHSCCALLASTNFKKHGRWHTLIDYERYFELLESGQSFGPEDYMGAETPEWALWGQGGFDPGDVRVDRKGKPIEPSESRERVIASNEILPQ